ncbi:hypothetical protein B7P43_G01119, partial [Cryptotermes secundus]
KLGKSGSETAESLGDNAMKKTAVYKWVTHFSEGRESVTDEESSGRPATNRTEEKNVREDRLTVRNKADEANIDRETVRKILTEDLAMRKVCKNAPSDLFLFPKIKKILNGRHFDDINDIRCNAIAALKAIP